MQDFCFTKARLHISDLDSIALDRQHKWCQLACIAEQVPEHSNKAKVALAAATGKCLLHGDVSGSMKDAAEVPAAMLVLHHCTFDHKAGAITPNVTHR